MLQQLQAIATREGDQTLVNDVIEACRLRRAFCFSAPDGWFVVQPLTKPVRHLLVVAAYSGGQQSIARYSPVIEQLAERIGLKVIRFRSKRPGYRRVMPKQGWQLLPDGQTWEKQLG
jgi:hypothetical protein